jgi:hypothetical protein
MHAENLLVHYSGYRQTVEAVGEGLPKLYIVPPLAYTMKGVEERVMNCVEQKAMIQLMSQCALWAIELSMFGSSEQLGFESSQVMLY